MLWLQYTYYTQLSTSDTNSFALSSLYNIIYHIIRDARAVRSVPVGICVYTSNLYVIFSFILYSWSVYTYSFSSNVSLTSLSTSLSHSLFPLLLIFSLSSPLSLYLLSNSMILFLYQRSHRNTGSSTTTSIASGTQFIIII